MKKILLTGAGGFLGAALTARLLAAGLEVTAVDRNTDALAPLRCDKLTLLQADLSSPDWAAGLPKGSFGAFYHLAWRGVNGPEKADALIQTENILLALRCADTAKALDCDKFLCAGTIAERAVESLPALEQVSSGMVYSAAKQSCHLLLEARCKNIGLNFVWMQLSNCYGPGNKTGNLISYTLGQLRKGEAATFGPAQQPYDFIFVKDMMEAMFRLGTMPTARHAYFIGSGKPARLADYLTAVGRLAGAEELIHIGERQDDGIRYAWDMLDTAPLEAEIGPYVSGTFEDHIRETLAAESR